MSWQGDTNVTLRSSQARWNRFSASATQIFNTSAPCSRRKGEIGVQQLGGAVMIIRVY